MPKSSNNKQQQERQERKKRLEKRLRAEIRQDMQPILLGSLAMICSSLSNQAVPRLLGKLLDQKSSSSTCSSSSSGGLSQSTWTSLALVVLGGGVASFVRTVMLNRAEDRIACRLRTNAFYSLLTQRDLEWFHMEQAVSTSSSSTTSDETDEQQEKSTEKETTTTLTTTSSVSLSTGMTPAAVTEILNTDASIVSHSLSTGLANMIRSATTIGYSTYHMLCLSPSLFGLSFGTVPLIGSAAMILRKYVKRLATKQRDTATLAASFAQERLLHLNMVKMSNRQEDEVQQYMELQEMCVKLGEFVSIANGAFMGFIFIASSGALIVVFNAGGKAVARGTMTAGDLTSFATYTFLLGLGTSGVFKALGELSQGLVSAARVYNIIDGPTDDETTMMETTTTTTTKQVQQQQETRIDVEKVDSISFSHVYFAYKSNPERNVLRDVSFTLERGRVVALVGKNGQGKTTIASLLAALYKPCSGSILLSPPNGIDYNTLNRNTQKELVQVVPQNPALFDTTIMENVKYTCPEATDEQAMEAMTMANCTDFVNELGGVEYRVGPNGNKLSGGQRQRVGLARAFLSNPTCLVLDEPTSSLDTEGQTAVTDAVLACRGVLKCALLLITHRAKTLQVADDVMVIKNGEIVETGNFETLTNDKDSELCALMPDLL